MFCLDMGALGGDARLRCPICHSEMLCLHLPNTFKAGKIKLYIYILTCDGFIYLTCHHFEFSSSFFPDIPSLPPSLPRESREISTFPRKKKKPQFSIKLINLFPIAS